MKEIVSKVKQAFIEKWEYQPQVSSAPGRINIIGEHIDYNDGWVLPGAIDKYIISAMGIRPDSGSVSVYSVDYNEAITLDTFPANDFGTGWQPYVIGILNELNIFKLGKGVDIAFGGNVPLGSGLSSSAALECSLAVGLNQLFDLGYDKKALALICQRVEHKYVGVKCGIMDQYSSMFGKEGQVMLLDCRDNTHQEVPLQLGEYSLLLCNTGVHHSLASSAYNERRKACEEGLEILKENGYASFRDVSESNFKALQTYFPDDVFTKCHYVVAEIDRVQKAVQALKDNQMKKLGGLLYETHTGLQQEYEVSCKELDFLVDLTRPLPYVVGARMMGGGFGGCTINVIRKDRQEDFIALASKAYKEAFNLDLKVIPVSISDGAQVQ
jgi:galactokinase